MTAAAIEAHRRVPRANTVRRLMTPRFAATLVELVRVVIAVVVVVLALTGLATTGAFLAGPIPDIGPKPGF